MSQCSNEEDFHAEVVRRNSGLYPDAIRSYRKRAAISRLF
jgi:hypothetical protein